MFKHIFIVISIILISACTYNANIGVQPSYNIYSSYEDKIPGKWAIYADSRQINYGSVNVDGHRCSGHKFTFSPGQAFSESAIKTFQNLIDDSQVVRAPISAKRLRNLGFDGLIIIRGTQIRADITFARQFFSSTAIADVNLTASISVIGPNGRLLGTTSSERGNGRSDEGMGCSGGTNAIRKATEESFKRVLTNLAERFASSRRVRNAVRTSAFAGGTTNSTRGSFQSGGDSWIGRGSKGACGKPWAIEITRRDGRFGGTFWRGEIEYDLAGQINSEGKIHEIFALKNRRFEYFAGPRVMEVRIEFLNKQANGFHYFGNNRCRTPIRLVPKAR